MTESLEDAKLVGPVAVEFRCADCGRQFISYDRPLCAVWSSRHVCHEFIPVRTVSLKVELKGEPAP